MTFSSIADNPKCAAVFAKIEGKGVRSYVIITATTYGGAAASRVPTSHPVCVLLTKCG